MSSVSTRRLLIVEDEVSTVFAVREFFAFNGYQVDCAACPPDAMMFLLRQRYDIVITDLHLTSYRCGEGMTVLDRARTLNPDALIVMLTAYATDGSEEDAYRHGATLFETKPIGLAELAARIEAVREGQGFTPPTHPRQEWGSTCPE